MTETRLTADEMYKIMFYLSTKDVLHCMQVCKYWKDILSNKEFWKDFVRRRFDLRVKTNIKDDPLYRWADPSEWSTSLHFYSEDEYVFRPFPTTWNCGVVVPFGLDPMVFDTKDLQGLSRSLEILTHMKKGIETFKLWCGTECGADSSIYGLSVVLMPWDDDELPSDLVIVKDIFPLHPEIVENVYLTRKSQDESELEIYEKIYFHHEQEHDPAKEDKKCLNQVFGRHWSRENDKTYDHEKELAFFTWLQNIMVPTRHCFIGYEVIRPIVVFFITPLAPGWIGGILTSEYFD